MTAALAPAYPVQSVATPFVRDRARHIRQHPVRATYNRAYRWADCGCHVVEAATGLVLNPRGWRADHLADTSCHGVVSVDR